jgi:hypothetical protein
VAHRGSGVIRALLGSESKGIIPFQGVARGQLEWHLEGHARNSMIPLDSDPKPPTRG